jgi:hypothetical protein
MDRLLSDEEYDPLEEGDLPEDNFWNLEEEALERPGKGFYEDMEDDVDAALEYQKKLRQQLDSLDDVDQPTEEDEDDERDAT